MIKHYFLTSIFFFININLYAKECNVSPNDQSLTPVIREKNGWHKKYENQKVAALKGGSQIIMIGDSMIELWPENIISNSFGGIKVLKLGIGGDRTQNVIWRLLNLDLSTNFPTHLILMIGTNNLTYKASICSIVAGIKAAAKEFHQKFPNAKLIVIGIPPRGEGLKFRKEDIIEINTMLREQIKSATFIDPQIILTEPDDSINIEPDLLHFSVEGYRKLTEILHQSLN